PPSSGIFGNAQAGCWSIALSGGWADDVDNGDVFTYTGSGGTLLSGTKNQPKNLRVAPQTFDQSFDHSFNAALKKSCDTGKPVRVIRGYKNPSKYAPVDGYRYDGLYTVIKCWMAPSIANRKLKVCRYALQRLGGQGEIGVKQPQAEDGEEEEAAAGEEAAGEEAGEGDEVAEGVEGEGNVVEE
ncbi:PUA-like domain-containing protein, partial [Mrakia frigida]|uniref:YDG/SRA domain-containing protein n=1 Tax=Mrakia frigida TaxID=29902 RepID=UPI003FCBF222